MYAYQLVEQATNKSKIRDVLLCEDSPFTILPIHQDVASLGQSLGTLDYVRLYDITKLMAPHVLNETFPCHFFVGNLAWMSEANGRYRYFSRHYNGRVHSFDIMDLLLAYYDAEHPGKVLERLSHQAGVIFLDKRWRKTQREKYLKNIESAQTVLALSPVSERLLSSSMELYRIMNEEGLRHLGPMSLSSHRDAMFFASARYLGEKIGESPSKVSRACLLLEAVGLIERIPDERIPSSFLEKSKEYGKNRARVNYFTIKNLSSQQDEFFCRCEFLIKHGIRASNITNKRLQSAYECMNIN